jgi:hypothetical protein
VIPLRVTAAYPDPVDDLTRAFEFERRWVERRSTRLEPFEFGVAYLDEEYPQRYFSNLLLADTRLDEASAEALIEAGQRLLGEAGYEHRLIIVRDERWAGRFAPAFETLGFRPSREITMVHRRDPDRDANLPVEEVPFAVVRPLIQQMYREDPDVPGDIALLFAEQHGKYERVADARFFAARVDGRLAGNCELYQEGDDAQVEHVGTLERSGDEGSLAPSSSERSERRGRPVPGTSSSSPMRRTGRDTCMHDSDSIRSDVPGSSSSRPMAAEASSENAVSFTGRAPINWSCAAKRRRLHASAADDRG